MGAHHNTGDEDVACGGKFLKLIIIRLDGVHQNYIYEFFIHQGKDLEGLTSQGYNLNFLLSASRK